MFCIAMICNKILIPFLFCEMIQNIYIMGLFCKKKLFYFFVSRWFITKFRFLLCFAKWIAMKFWKVFCCMKRMKFPRTAVNFVLFRISRNKFLTRNGNPTHRCSKLPCFTVPTVARKNWSAQIVSFRSRKISSFSENIFTSLKFENCFREVPEIFLSIISAQLRRIIPGAWWNKRVRPNFSKFGKQPECSRNVCGF